MVAVISWSNLDGCCHFLGYGWVAHEELQLVRGTHLGVIFLPFTSDWMLKKSPSSLKGPTTIARSLSNVRE